MKYLFLLVFIGVSIHKNIAQNYNIIIPDTFYYPVDNDIQMIEIAYKKPRKINYPQSDNIYIFRNTKGEILKVFNKNKEDLDLTLFAPINKEYYTEDFLLYQYCLGEYKVKNSNKIYKLFVYKNEENLCGIINQYGDIIVSAKYLGFYMPYQNRFLVTYEFGDIVSSFYHHRYINNNIFDFEEIKEDLEPVFKEKLPNRIHIGEEPNIAYPMYIALFHSDYYVIDTYLKKVLCSCYIINHKYNHEYNKRFDFENQLPRMDGYEIPIINKYIRLSCHLYPIHYQEHDYINILSHKREKI